MLHTIRWPAQTNADDGQSALDYGVLSAQIRVLL